MKIKNTFKTVNVAKRLHDIQLQLHNHTRWHTAASFDQG